MGFMQLFIYVKPSSLPPCIPDLIPLRKQTLYYTRAGKLRLTWLLLRLLVSQWLAGKEAAGMSCTAPHRQCALWPCFAFWTPAALSLQSGMELGASSAEQTCWGMFADSSRLQPAPPQAQTLLRCCSLRRRRPCRTQHPKVRGGTSLFSSFCCRGLSPPSCSLCCRVCCFPLSAQHPEVDMDHWLYQSKHVVGLDTTCTTSPSIADSSQEHPGASTASQILQDKQVGAEVACPMSQP